MGMCTHLAVGPAAGSRVAAGLVADVRVAVGPRQAAELEPAVGAQVVVGLLLVGVSGDSSVPRQA